MSRVCDVCQKGYMKGNLVPRGIGKRVTGRTTKRQQPNIRTKRMNIGGVSMKVKLCAACLKRIKKDAMVIQDTPGPK
jgi:large subunit ribosomal protein L28